MTSGLILDSPNVLFFPYLRAYDWFLHFSTEPPLGAALRPWGNGLTAPATNGRSRDAALQRRRGLDRPLRAKHKAYRSLCPLAKVSAKERRLEPI